MCSGFSVHHYLEYGFCDPESDFIISENRFKKMRVYVDYFKLFLCLNV